MVLVLHKELEYKVEKLRYKKFGGHAIEDQKQIRTFHTFQLVNNYPGSVHAKSLTKFYSRDWLKHSIIY